MQKYFFIFDLDYTLFDAHAFRTAFMRAAEVRGISGDEFMSWFRMRPETRQDWHMNFLLERAGEENRNADIARLRRGIEYIISTSRHFLYPDVLPALARMHHEGHALALCTHGEREFQEQKILYSYMAPFFTFTRVTNDVEKAHDVEELCAQAHSRFGHRETFFIEDNPAALAAAKKRLPFITAILMQRSAGGKYAEFETQRPFIDHIVKNMEGVEHVVRRYERDGERITPAEDMRENSWKPSYLAKIIKKK